jgi:Transcriptional regulator, AbiEi antitoxin
MSPKDITIVTGMGRRAVDLLLLRMVRAGEITRIKRGLYSLPKYAPQEPLKD